MFIGHFYGVQLGGAGCIEPVVLRWFGNASVKDVHRQQQASRALGMRTAWNNSTCAQFDLSASECSVHGATNPIWTFGFICWWRG